MGAGVVGRNTLAGIRKIGAGEERRKEIDRSTHEANALRIFDSMTQMKGAFMKLARCSPCRPTRCPSLTCASSRTSSGRRPPMHATHDAPAVQ